MRCIWWPTSPATSSVVPRPRRVRSSALSPVRIMDTRTNLGATGPVPAWGTISLQVLGQGGVPASGVSAVVLNVTVADPQSSREHHCVAVGQPRQETSNLNFQVGQNIPNLVMVPVGADGKIQLYNQSAGALHLVADVAGYILGGTPTAPGSFSALSPVRIMDTRLNLGATGPVPAWGTTSLQVLGQGGVPASGVSAVVLNVTVADPQSSGNITVWPSGQPRQETSNLNFQVGQNIPNLVMVPVGADGKIQLYNESAGCVASGCRRRRLHPRRLTMTDRAAFRNFDHRSWKQDKMMLSIASSGGQRSRLARPGDRRHRRDDRHGRRDWRWPSSPRPMRPHRRRRRSCR